MATPEQEAHSRPLGKEGRLPNPVISPDYRQFIKEEFARLEEERREKLAKEAEENRWFNRAQRAVKSAWTNTWEHVKTHKGKYAAGAGTVAAAAGVYWFYKRFNEDTEPTLDLNFKEAA